jgi:L-asparaginase II
MSRPLAESLARAGLDPSELRCGAHWPINQVASHALAREGGSATALHNNCSGKHAGFLCVAGALGADRADYTNPRHPVQREVKAVLESLAGSAIGEDACAIDGCSVPTWALPLEAWAQAFARFGTGAGVSADRDRAAVRLRAACAMHPWHVAGTGRFCTEIMRRFGPRIFLKTGAEGVYCAALPDLGLGIAIKCDDGGGRAAEVAVAAVLARHLPDDRAALEPFVRPSLRNWNGIAVGELRPTGIL